MRAELKSGQDVRIWAASTPRRAEVQPSLWNPKRKLRHLWMIRATEPHAVFLALGQQLVNEFRQNPLLGYPEFAEDLETKTAMPYERPRDSIRFFEFAALDLPESARAFTIINHKGRTQQVDTFASAARKKIASDFPWESLSAYGTGNDNIVMTRDNRESLFHLMDDIAENDVQFLENALATYQSVGPEVLQLLGATISRIKALPSLNKRRTGWLLGKLVRSPADVVHDDPEVYYGRDAKWLFLARKADQIGNSGHNRLHYLVASRTILDSDAFKRYLQDIGIPYNAYHIDVAAWNGTAIHKVLELLGGKDTSPKQREIDFNKQARFIATGFGKETQLFPENDQLALLEAILENIEKKLPGIEPNSFKEHRNGRIEPEFNSQYTLLSYMEKIRAWAMDQAVTRHFLPKTTS